MRIFLAIAPSPNNAQLPQSQVWRANWAPTLQAMGHEIVEFDYPWTLAMIYVDPHLQEHREFIAWNRPRQSAALWEQVRAAHRQRPVDLSLSYFSSAHVEPEVVRRISQLGIPTVNWYCNASYQFHLVEEIASAFDLCLVPERFRLADYRRVGARPLYCQEAANPDVYRPFPLPRRYDVTFVGQKYGTRPLFIEALLQAGVDTRVWGPGWQTHDGPSPARRRWRMFRRRLKSWLRGRPYRPTLALAPHRCGPPLSDDELVKMYSRSQVSLGFTSVAEIPADGSPPIKQVRLRDFEATMSGAFYLVEHVEELYEFFEPGAEIVPFHDAEELAALARYYLKHEAERERIRQAGMRRARADHTWRNRFEMVLRHLGLDRRLGACAG